MTSTEHIGPFWTGNHIAVFALAAAGLGLEIVLTRIFSLLFQYHYAFLALSLAVLGVSLGAAAAQLAAVGHRWQGGRGLALLPLVLAGVGLLMARVPLPGVWSHALLALLPFAVIGFATTTRFAEAGAQSGTLYAADLAGAGAGLLLALLLLTVWSPFTIIYFFALATAGVNLASTSTRGGRAASALLLALVALLWLINLQTGLLNFDPQRLAAVPRDKTMLALLHDPAAGAEIERTLWSPFARVDVVRAADPAAKFVFSDGGAGSAMLRFDDNLEAVASQRNAPEYIPFATGGVTETLILGAGAGRDVVLALLAGAGEITAVEVNPAVVAATRADGAYNGHIYDRPNVHVITGDARTFVERTDARYDLLYLNLVYTQAADPTGQALVENYIFTTQAFQTYWQRLRDDGRVALIAHNALEGSRAMVTALRALDQLGIPPAQALDHMALWVLPEEDPTLRTTVFILSRQAFTEPFTEEERQALGQAAAVRGLQPLFMPVEYEQAFAPLRLGMGLGDFVRTDAAYDLSPTNDNRPFFFNLDPGLPAPIRQALWSACTLALLMTLLALGAEVGRGVQTHRDAAATLALPFWLALLYAALIGAGFMLIEIALLQHIQLLLGYPVFTLATVLGTLLLVGGAGSWISQRWPTAALLRRVPLALLLVGGVSLVYWLALPPLVQQLLPAATTVRLLCSVILVLIPALIMGVPFPSLLRLLQIAPRRIAWAWSINGIFSVVGSTAAIALAMAAGFGAVLLVGALCYGVLALLLWRFSTVKLSAN